MQITKQIRIDMANRQLTETVYAVQGDSNTRIVVAKLFENNIPWEVPKNVTAAVAFSKPDGTKGLYDQLPNKMNAVEISGNIVTAVLAPQVLSTSGNVDASVVFHDSNLNQLATFPFKIIVSENPSADGIVSNDYYKYSTMEEISDAVDAAITALERSKEDFLSNAEEALQVVKDTATEDAPAIVCEASGENISVADASDRVLQKLSILGKTTQNGTPTPSAPVPLESAGESGAICVTVAGKNLLGRDGTNITDGSSYSGITFHENGDGTFRVSGTCTDAFVRIIGDVILPAGTYTVSQANGTMSYMAYQLWEVAADGSLSNNRQVDTSTPKQTFTLTQTTKLHARFFANTGAAPNNFTAKVQIEVGETATEWEAHKPTQNLTASTEGGLHSIGDVCDEIDFARGVRVQRFHEVDMGTCTVRWVDAVKQFFVDLPYDKPMKNAPNNTTAINAICSAYPVASYDAHLNYDYAVSAPSGTGVNVRLNDKRFGAGQEAEMKAALSGVKLVYELATPIETPLSAEELASFAALHSHKPNTTAFNDGGAEMKLAYNADTKLYIDNKFNELATAILNNA